MSQQRFAKGGIVSGKVGLLKKPYIKKDGTRGQDYISSELVGKEIQRVADRQAKLFNRFCELVGFQFQSDTETFASTSGDWTQVDMADLWDGAPKTASGVILDVEIAGVGAYIAFSDEEDPDTGKTFRAVGFHATNPTTKTFILPLNEEAYKRIWYASTASATVRLIGWLTMPSEE